MTRAASDLWRVIRRLRVVYRHLEAQLLRVGNPQVDAELRDILRVQDMVNIDLFLELHRGGLWVFAGEMMPNPERFDDHDKPLDEREAPRLAPESFYNSANKELAAILTDHINPFRSAEAYVPVAPARGLPRDLSPELAAWLRPSEGERSVVMSWFTARELLEFGWTERLMRRRAQVEARHAALFAGCPRGFPAGPDHYAEDMRDGVTVEWVETYAEIAGDFLEDVLPRLARLEEPDRARLVVEASW